MVRRISPSQFRSKLRQLEQKQKRAIDAYNREVRAFNQKARQHNQKVNQAIGQLNRDIDRYNAAARSHNQRVRANRDRLRRELQRLANTSSQPRLVEYRTAVDRTQASYERLEHHAEGGTLGEGYNALLDLSEREAANNAAVMNALLGDSTSDEPQAEESNPSLLAFLKSISDDLAARWKGALFALNPQNPDAARHFCTSAREVITQVLEIKAPDEVVFAALPGCDRTDRGNATRRARITYFLKRKGLADDYVAEFVESDMTAVVRLFNEFNSGTHGPANTFTQAQLKAIRKRVEDAIAFLAHIID